MNGLNGILSGIVQRVEDDSWKEKNKTMWGATITYEHGGAYYCFKMEKAQRDKEHPAGITEETLREIAKALPTLKPLADGLARRFTLGASQLEIRSQRKL